MPPASHRRNGGRAAPAPCDRRPVHLDGIAVRFALVICDSLAAESYYAACERDRITLRFPGEDITIAFRQGAGGVRIAFTGTRHRPRDGRPALRCRELTVPGSPGSAAQRAAVLREIAEFRQA